MTMISRGGSRRVAALLLALLLAGLGGCSALTRKAMPLPQSGPDQIMVEDVPFFPQEQYQCGPASLAMTLGWSGISVKPDEIAPEVYSPKRQGSLQAALLGGARRHGRVAYPIFGTGPLLAELAAGRPVIVLFNRSFSWYPKWHYAVAIGYDQPASEIILHSGTTPNKRLSFRVFENLWARSERWGLLVLPPDTLPVNAHEPDWLAAVVGLERVGQWRTAAIAYDTALNRWPQSFGALMGLGNSRYQLDDFEGAASAFRMAARLHPQNGIVYNNLALTLFELGKQSESLSAARQAVSLGGPLKAQFEQTLLEIESQIAQQSAGATLPLSRQKAGKKK